MWRWANHNNIVYWVSLLIVTRTNYTSSSFRVPGT